MTGFMVFLLGLATGAIPVWLWFKVRDDDDREAVRQQFDNGLGATLTTMRASDPQWSYRVHPTVPLAVSRRVARKVKQMAAVDNARARMGLPPILFYDPPQRHMTDDDPDGWSV